MVLGLLATTFLLAACGNEELAPRRDCALTVTLSGAIDIQRDARNFVRPRARTTLARAMWYRSLS